MYDEYMKATFSASQSLEHVEHATSAMVQLLGRRLCSPNLLAERKQSMNMHFNDSC